MRKITLLLCAMMVSLVLVAQPPEPTLKQLWKQTSYSWNSGNLSRSMVFYNGKLYVPYNFGTTSAVRVIDAATGVEDVSATITHGDFQSFGIAVDNAGHLVLPKNTGGGAAWMLSRVDIATGTVKAMNSGAAFNSDYRIDYLAVLGNIESTDEPAYIIGAGTVAKHIKAWEMMSGERTTTDPFLWERPAASIAADIKWIDKTQFLLTQQWTAATVNPLIMTVDFSNPSAYITQTDVINIEMSQTGGGAYFELDDVPYLALPIGNDGKFGSIGIFDITYYESPEAIGEPTEVIGNNANETFHVGIEAVKVAKDKAIIYVWAPNNGAAAYEFTAGGTGIKGIAKPKSEIRVIRTAEGIEIPLDGVSTVELYTVSGLLIDKAVAKGSYTKALDQGMYVVRVNGKTAKVVK